MVSFGKETVVKGLAPTFVGKQVKLYRFADYISFTKKVIAETEVQEDSSFHMAFDLKETTELILAIGPSKGYMYAQPGAEYMILYPRLDLEQGQRMRENVVQVIFDSLPETDINFKILDFDYRLDGFIGNTFEFLASDEWKVRLGRFKKHMYELYDTVDSRYFKDHVQYSVAMVEQIGHIRENLQRSKLEVYNTYIANQPVKYGHPKYMGLINQFYSNSIRTAPVEMERQFYKGILKRNDSLCLDVLGRSDYLRDPRLRELVFIIELVSAYKSEEYPKAKIIDMLDTLAVRAEFPEHRPIAKNVRARMLHLAKGHPAPHFELLSTADTLVDLSDLQGKHVYLNFFEDWCSRCFEEMRIIRRLREKYGEDISFVSISLDDSLEQVKRAVDNNLAFDWHFLHYGNNEELKEAYRIYDLPVYYLIDPDGNILEAPALGPSPNGSYETIDRKFWNIYKRLHPEEDKMPKKPGGRMP